MDPEADNDEEIQWVECVTCKNDGRTMSAQVTGDVKTMYEFSTWEFPVSIPFTVIALQMFT